MSDAVTPARDMRDAFLPDVDAVPRRIVVGAAVAVRACVEIALRDTDGVAVRDWDDGCDAVRTTGVVVARDTVVRDAVPDVAVDVGVRCNTFDVARPEDDDCDDAPVVRADTLRTGALVRETVVTVVRARAFGVAAVAFDVRETVADSPVSDDCVRAIVVAPRRVAARATASDESSAYASHTNMPSIPRQHNKNRLIPVIPLLYM